MARSVDGKVEVNGALAVPLAEGRVQPLVSVFRRAPNLVLDGPVDVVLRVRLDDEETGVFGRQVKLFRVVNVFRLQFFQHRIVGGRNSCRNRSRWWWRGGHNGCDSLWRSHRIVLLLGNSSRRRRSRASWTLLLDVVLLLLLLLLDNRFRRNWNRLLLLRLRLDRLAR